MDSKTAYCYSAQKLSCQKTCLHTNSPFFPAEDMTFISVSTTLQNSSPTLWRIYRDFCRSIVATTQMRHFKLLTLALK